MISLVVVHVHKTYRLVLNSLSLDTKVLLFAQAYIYLSIATSYLMSFTWNAHCFKIYTHIVNAFTSAILKRSLSYSRSRPTPVYRIGDRKILIFNNRGVKRS